MPLWNPKRSKGRLLAALRQVNYATIANYLAMELRYMDAGG
jgi:hypothetical protein